jgi:hypothetical protein
MKRTEINFEMPEGVSKQRAAGYLLFKELLNGPKSGVEVKKVILETLGMKYCGTVIQHHVKSGHISRTYPKGEKNRKAVIYALHPKGGWAYAYKTFGLLTDARRTAMKKQAEERAAKAKLPKVKIPKVKVVKVPGTVKVEETVGAEVNA